MKSREHGIIDVLFVLLVFALSATALTLEGVSSGKTRKRYQKQQSFECYHINNVDEYYKKCYESPLP